MPWLEKIAYLRAKDESTGLNYREIEMMGRPRLKSMRPSVFVFALVIGLSSGLVSPTPSSALTCDELFARGEKAKPSFWDRRPIIRPGNRIALQVANPHHPWGPLVNWLALALNLPVEAHRINDLLRKMDADTREIPFWIKLADAAGVSGLVSDEMMAKIPKTGPVVIPMNHVLYGWDAVAFMAKLTRIRPDAKVLMTDLLQAVPGLKERAYLVNVYTKDKSQRQALVEQITADLKQGGVLVYFPSGTHAHRDRLLSPVSTDQRWSQSISRYIDEVEGLQVVPVAVEADPGLGLTLARKISATLSQIFIFRGMARNTLSSIPYSVGTPVPREVLLPMTPEQRLVYLRARLEVMRDIAKKAKPRKLEPVPEPTSFRAVEKELFNNPNTRLLYDSNPQTPGKGYVVMWVYGKHAPNTLRELGRQRNLAFRPEGEGNRKGLDIDSYDLNYRQLVMIDKMARQSYLESEKAHSIGSKYGTLHHETLKLNDEMPYIAGAYRIGLIRELLKGSDTSSIYTTLFVGYDDLLMNEFRMAIELGRAFIQVKHRGGRSLMTMWRGIAQMIIDEKADTGVAPTNLIGPLSLSGTYKENLKLLLVYSRSLSRKSPLSDKARPRTPPRFTTTLTAEQIRSLAAAMQDESVRTAMIKDIEQNPKAELPPLFGLYDALGAQDLAVNLDTEFNSLDWLIHVDLLKAPRRQLEFILGRDLYREFSRAIDHPDPPTDP